MINMYCAIKEWVDEEGNKKVPSFQFKQMGSDVIWFMYQISENLYKIGKLRNKTTSWLATWYSLSQESKDLVSWDDLLVIYSKNQLLRIRNKLLGIPIDTSSVYERGIDATIKEAEKWWKLFQEKEPLFSDKRNPQEEELFSEAFQQLCEEYKRAKESNQKIAELRKSVFQELRP